MHARSCRAREIALPTGTVWLAAITLIAVATIAGAFGHRVYIACSDARPAPAAGSLAQAVTGQVRALPHVPGGDALAAQAQVSRSTTVGSAATLWVPGVPLLGVLPDSMEMPGRANVIGVLADRVGALQARMTSLENTSDRLARTGLGADLWAHTSQSGRDDVKLSAPSPGVLDTPLGADDLSMSWTLDAGHALTADASIAPVMSAADLSQVLDRLQHDMAYQQDLLSVYDDALTHRAAEHARMPSYVPVTDFPYLSSSYGWRRHPVTGRSTMHEGLDFAAPRGTPIYASAAGIVVAAKYVNGYGKLVEIEHGNSILTRYAHSARLYVKQGDLVERGQLIAEVGSSGRSTGPHLHFEVRMAGQPLDPRLFLGDQAPAGSTIVRADHEAGLSP